MIIFCTFTCNTIFSVFCRNKLSQKYVYFFLCSTCKSIYTNIYYTYFIYNFQITTMAAGGKVTVNIESPAEFPFPFTPYDIQKDFMKSLFTTLNEG
jgi:hypothetical protein